MAEERTLFQKIADREIPADVVFEDDSVMAFRDINPQAPVHILVVPRKPIRTIDDLEEADDEVVGRLFRVASKIAADEGLENGYRVVMNCGPDGQQSVYHIHLHLLGGRKMNWPPG
jgi:histidine triad (HIT) family protein